MPSSEIEFIAVEEVVELRPGRRATTRSQTPPASSSSSPGPIPSQAEGMTEWPVGVGTGTATPLPIVPLPTTADLKPPPPTEPRRRGIPEAMLGTFQAIAFALNARLLLLLALIGAFVLSVLAMGSQTTAAIIILVAYAVLTVVPLAVLEVVQKRPRE